MQQSTLSPHFLILVSDPTSIDIDISITFKKNSVNVCHIYIWNKYGKMLKIVQSNLYL